jgi:hypothetical protein
VRGLCQNSTKIITAVRYLLTLEPPRNIQEILLRTILAKFVKVKKGKAIPVTGHGGP